MTMQMGRLLDQNFQLFSTDQMADAAAPHGDSVRVRKLGTAGYPAPDALYLVYVKLESNDSLTVRHMSRQPLLNNNIADTEDYLFGLAEAGEGSPEQVGREFNTMAFKRPTYFTVVLDNDGWDFYYPNPSAVVPVPGEFHDPIMFIERKVTLVEQGGSAPVRVVRNFEPNTSFYDAKSVNIRTRQAVRCVNFFRDADGTELNRYQDLGFEILVRAPFFLSRAQGRKLILIIDPDGQNQGPRT